MTPASLVQTVFGRASMLLAGGSMVQALVAFAANLILVRLIAPDGFGRFAVVWAGAGMAFSLLSLRINVLIIRCPAGELDQRRRDAYATAVLAETVLATGATLAWLAISGLESPFEVVLVAAMAVAHWTNQVRAFFERSMPFARLAGIETLSALLAHGSAVALAAAGFGVAALYLREAVLAGTMLAGLALVGGIAWRRPARLLAAEWRAIFREGRGVWLDSVLDGSFQRLVILAAGGLAGLTVTGYLFQAWRLASVPHQFLTPFISRVAGVWFGRTEDARHREAGRRHALMLSAVVLVPAAGLAAAFADPIVPIVFGEAWRPAASLLAILSGLVLFLTLFETDRTYCLSTRRARALMVARLAQYAGFGVAFLSAVLGWVEPGPALAMGLSLAFAAAFLTIEGWLALDRRA
jgi:O-antigen/teichoic acid export membrane protein